MRMILTAGQVHEATQASILIEGLADLAPDAPLAERDWIS